MTTKKRSTQTDIWSDLNVDSSQKQQNYWLLKQQQQQKRKQKTTKTKRHARNPEKHQTNVWVGGMLVTVGVTLALIFGLRHK
jgi:hypothetical protein